MQNNSEIKATLRKSRSSHNAAGRYKREFAGCDDIRTVTIPDSTSVIKKEALACIAVLLVVNNR